MNGEELGSPATTDLATSEPQSNILVTAIIFGWLPRHETNDLSS
jgi:hypothetical protein